VTLTSFVGSVIAFYTSYTDDIDSSDLASRARFRGDPERASLNRTLIRPKRANADP